MRTSSLSRRRAGTVAAALLIHGLCFGTLAWGAGQDVRLEACKGLLIHGQKSLNATNGSEALATTQTVCALSVKASCANTVDVMVGATALNYSSSKGRTLSPCEHLDVPVEDPADVFLDAGTTASQIVEYLGVLGP